MSHAEHMRIHLIGMWVAFGVAAGFIVYFLLRITKALATRDAELEAARHLALRQEKLASLATLAAGTAHELATPLSTIALVARELDHELAGGTKLEAARADAKLIREQVQRCRAILDHMSVRGGEFAAESLTQLDLTQVISEAVSQLAADPPIRLTLGKHTAECVIDAPPKALAMTLQNLLKNAQDASRSGQEIVVSTELVAQQLRIHVKDRGRGNAARCALALGRTVLHDQTPGKRDGTRHLRFARHDRAARR